MKAFIILCTIVLFGFGGWTQETETENVKKVIQSAYVEGIHARAGIDKIEKGIHPGFEMIGISNDLLTRYPIYSWIETIKKAMAENKPIAEKITATYPIIDVSGNAAMARVDLFKGGKHIFTDYMSLYKFDDGWKIVAKTYCRIPESQK